MTEQPAGPKGPSLEFPIPIRASSPTGGGPGEKPKTVDEMYKGIMETLDTNLKMEGAARVGKAYSTSPAGDQAARPETDGRSAVKPFEELDQAAKIFGIDFNRLMERKDDEIQALRDATDAQSREVHELRLKELTQTEDRIRNIAKGFAENRAGGGGDLGATMGLGDLDPEVRKALQERAFGLSKPDRDGGEPKPPAPFSIAWFKEWEELAPGVRSVARMFGMVPKDEAGSNEMAIPMVTMDDVRSGKVPIELAISLRKVESEAELERMRIEKEDARENKRIDVFGQLSTTLKDNLPDAFAAIRDLAAEHAEAAEDGGPGGADRGEVTVLKGIKCEKCGYEFRVEQELEHFSCPRCGVDLDVDLEPPTTAEQPATAEEPATNVTHVTQGEDGAVLRV